MMRMESFLLIMATLGKVDEFNMSKEKEERSLAEEAFESKGPTLLN